MIEPKLSRFFLLPLVVLLAACTQEKGASALQNYQSRLENVFEEILFDAQRDQEHSAFDAGFADEFAPALPKAAVKATSLEQGSAEIDLLDFLSLYGLLKI